MFRRPGLQMIVQLVAAREYLHIVMHHLVISYNNANACEEHTHNCTVLKIECLHQDM